MLSRLTLAVLVQTEAMRDRNTVSNNAGIKLVRLGITKSMAHCDGALKSDAVNDNIRAFSKHCLQGLNSVI